MRILTENPLLKKKCKLVTIDQGRLIARRMVAYLLANNKKNKTNKAIGVAANQFGIDASVAIVLIKQKPLILINPKIKKFSEVKFMHKEGCLSFPQLWLKVKRHRAVTVEYFDKTGKECIIELSGIDARCFLHELDHLDGKVFTQKVSPLKVVLAYKKQLKRKRNG